MQLNSFFPKIRRQNYSLIEEAIIMPRKGRNIYKRKDGRWEGRYIRSRDISGKAVYGYVYGKTYKEAKDKLGQAAATPALSPSEISQTFGYWSEQWYQMLTPQIKESTGAKYQGILYNHIFPSFSERKICEMSNQEIESYITWLAEHKANRGKGLSPKTISDILSVIRSVLRYSLRNGQSCSVDIQAIQIKQIPSKMRVLSRQEQEALCKHIYQEKNWCNIGILLCLFTGLRVGELCALRWEDILFHEQVLYVRHTMQRIQTHSTVGVKTKVIITKPKSTHSERIVPIPEPLLPILMEYQQTNAGYFLTNSESRYIEPRVMQNHFKAIAKDCGFPDATFHSLRHTFATRCVEVGFDVKSLSEILGHASVNITMNRYVHPSMEWKKENMKRLSELISVK